MNKRDAAILRNIQPSAQLRSRVFKLVEKTDDCWIWKGTTDKGYGVTSLIPRISVLAHRLIYSWYVGEIPPEEFVLDHVCHNRDKNCLGGVTCLHRRCVNPYHIELVTYDENKIRGIIKRPNNGFWNKSKTHCAQGHEFTPENTYLRPKKYGVVRNCRTCIRNSVHKYEQKKRTS